MRKSFTVVKRRTRLIAISLAAIGMVFGNLATVSAALLTDVSVELDDPRTDETSVQYTIDASSFTASTANCVRIIFNDQADGGGAVPSSMVTTTGAFVSSTAIPTPASWTKTFTTNGQIDFTYGTGETLVNGNFIVDTIENGDTEGTTYFMLINTYANVDCSTSPLDNAVAAFIFKDGEPVSLTIEPTLTFTCTGVASGLDVFPVGGPGTVDTTVLSDASGIDHGTTVTSSVNGLSAHDVNVSTNASSGYNVYVRHTQAMTNQTTDTIADHTGTNAAPTAFPAAGTEAWGYSTDDADLTQFHGLNLWAGFPTAGGSGGDQVMTNSGATSGTDTVRVGHQVGVATSTPAGTYTTTIVYTVVATF
jgi:hypothetical protein